MQTVQWKIGWKSPLSIVGLYLVAAGLAVGHHLYYKSLDGKPARNQEV